MRTAKQLWAEPSVTGLGIDRKTGLDIVLQIQIISAWAVGVTPPLKREETVFVIYYLGMAIEKGVFFRHLDQAVAWFEKMTSTTDRSGCMGVDMNEIIKRAFS